MLKQWAFHSKPSDLRQRTAAHKAKRVSQRLRARAVHDMTKNKTPIFTFIQRPRSSHDRLRSETAAALRTLGRKKEVINRLVSESLRRGNSQFHKRQKNKVWLPTHLWHAKRAHMRVRWGFMLTESPNDSSFRDTQCAVKKRGVVAWDTSYMGSILVRGDEAQVRAVLEEVCRDAGTDNKVRAGKRSKECWAYHRGGYPTRPIAPVTVVWSPAAAADNTARRVLVRVHPCAFLDVWEELVAAIRAQNDAAGGAQAVFVDDLRFDLGSIQIAGPAATETLLAVLTPLDPAGATEQVWAGLRGVTNPLSLPPDVVFGFDVADPRLRFPPRLEPSALTPAAQEARLFELQSTWPLPPTPFALLDPAHRTAAVKLQASHKRIAARKAAAPPGTFPQPQATDPRIPVLLLSTPLCPSARPNGAPGPGAWTVVIPWKWVQPVWYALQHADGGGDGVRFGGLQEQRRMAFDHGLPWFPGDFAGTRAGQQWEAERASERRETWNKKPPAKQFNYDAVAIAGRRGELGRWDRCDWDKLVPPPVPAPGAMNVDSPLRCWQVPTVLVTAFLGSGCLPPSAQHTGADELAAGVFGVKITLVHRGTPSDAARVYRLPAGDASWAAFVNAMKGKGKGKVVVPQAGQRGYPECPGEQDLVGFVSTGNYSLSEGRMLALGGIVWGKWFTGEGGAERTRGERWCVVRGVGETAGRLGRWEVV